MYYSMVFNRCYYLVSIKVHIFATGNSSNFFNGDRFLNMVIAKFISAYSCNATKHAGVSLRVNTSPLTPLEST